MQTESGSNTDNSQPPVPPSAGFSVKGYLFGGLVVLALLLLNQFLFSYFLRLNYLLWYLNSASVIGLATTVASLSWGDINKNVGLVSSHPLVYLSACCWQVALPFFALGTHLRRSENPNIVRSTLDILLTLIITLFIGLILLAWIFSIAPIQYFTFLICGAPARLYMQSEWKPAASLASPYTLELDEVPMEKNLEAPWWDASIFSRPVSFTALISAPFFMLVNHFI